MLEGSSRHRCRRKACCCSGAGTGSDTGLINFSIDSTLKTRIDHIARAGLTFTYTENGPVGPTSGKKACIVLAFGLHRVRPHEVVLARATTG
ncbi:NAD(P)H-dependent oxidoreductase [Trinickia terrae]|uniref:NAD(P)H-dependent oxidoreductase n=1 Tax=Trinickia terrae TaxID=2571161 RepID=UPI0034E2106D